MKTKLTKGILLIMSLLCILCVPVTPVYAAQQGAGDCSRYILICMNSSTSIPEPENTLIVMQVLKKKRENEAPDDEEDEE